MRTLLIHGSRIVFLSLIFVLSSFGQEHFFPDIYGWKLTQDTLVYDANNLWDIIDGAADLYLEYTCINLHIARYTNAENVEVKAELYRHNSERNAFGIYSQERDPSYHFIQIGVQGYIQQGVLNFFAGVYYVKLSTYELGNAGEEALLTIGRKLDEHLRQNTSWPALLQLFPATGKISNTDQYRAKNFLGYSCMNSAFIAAYKDSISFKAFIIETDSPNSAETMMHEFLRSVSKEAVKKLDDSHYEIQDTFNGLIGIAMQKNFLFGIINCTDKRKREAYIEELKVNLSKIELFKNN